MIRTGVFVSVLSLMILFPAVVHAAARVKAWALPKEATGNPAKRATWKALASGTAATGGLALENRKLIVAIQPGTDMLRIFSKTKGADVDLQLGLTAKGGTIQSIEKVALSKLDGNEGAARLTMGVAQVDLILGAGRPYLQVVPAKGAEQLRVSAQSRYALLPDFFADDTVYDAQRFTSKSLTVPAENFLLQFMEGGRAIVACIWPGSLKQSVATQNGKGTPTASPEKADPHVSLHFSGSWNARKIAESRIEFQDRPIYIAVLEHDQQWLDLDVASWPGYTPKAIDWKRPFEAKWRANFVVAEGKETQDWHTLTQSFDFRGPVKKGQQPWWGKKGSTPERPMIWEESLGRIIFPCWFKDEQTHLCLYADAAQRKLVEKHNKAEHTKASKAKKSGQTYTPPALKTPPNIYERVLIYPVDRTADTPVSTFTLVDVMRDTLGAGPCEYILDLEGIKARPDGGNRALLEQATCPLWDKHVYPILRGVTAETKLPEEKKTHLIQALLDMRTFVHAVHDRIREYKKWGLEMEAFCKDQAAKTNKVKPLADKVLKRIAALNRDVGSLKFEGNGSEKYWHDTIETFIGQVKLDQYKDVNKVRGIRNLGNRQDQMVARCRRYVKGLRQIVTLADVTDPDVRTFANTIRVRSQEILRNKHHKEGL